MLRSAVITAGLYRGPDAAAGGQRCLERALTMGVSIDCAK
jgi:hypothetical protein